MTDVVRGVYQATPITLADNDRGNLLLDAQGNLRTVGGGVGTPTGATYVSAGSGNIANNAAVATLPAVASKTNYLSGFQITGAGATAGAVVSVTVTGLLGGTRTYTYTFATGAAVGNTPLIVYFDPPIPASAINTAIVVSCPASGAGGTNNTCNAQGFVL